MPYKEFTTIPEQLALLAERGMRIDRDEARAWLTHVGYYRLSGYWYPYRVQAEESRQRLDVFEPGTDFHSVALLYEFDRKLRALLFDGIERLEVALRAALVAYIGIISPTAYLDAKNFRSAFNYEWWLETVDKRIDRLRDRNDAVRHWYEHHDEPLPIWILMEILDFSDISILYSGLPTATQWSIADQLGLGVELGSLSKNQRISVLKRHPLSRWLQQMSIVRNVCAHHGRLWNQHFLPVSTAAFCTNPKLVNLPPKESKQVYGVIELISCVLAVVSPGNSWRAKVDELITSSFTTIPGRSTSEIGYLE